MKPEAEASCEDSLYCKKYQVKMDECHTRTFTPTYAACKMDYKMLNTQMQFFFLMQCAACEHCTFCLLLILPI